MKSNVKPKKKKKKCLHLGLNQGPSDLQSDALPTELKRLQFPIKLFPLQKSEEIETDVWKIREEEKKRIHLSGFEPETSSVLTRRHNQLDHKCLLW